jgi:hypothetical protein
MVLADLGVHRTGPDGASGDRRRIDWRRLLRAMMVAMMVEIHGAPLVFG